MNTLCGDLEKPYCYMSTPGGDLEKPYFNMNTLCGDTEKPYCNVDGSFCAATWGNFKWPAKGPAQEDQTPSLQRKY